MGSKTKWGRILLSGASLAAMGAFSPALAQDVSEEIVVTATGRSAAIQDVPLAVTALGAESLENAGVQSLMDVEQLAPGFRIYAGQSTTTGTIARIRGLGTGSDNPGFESAVGIFIDGVYRPRSGAAMSDLPELERIEVLRGPQGTLFGRNTSAGAISVVTAGPDFSGMSGWAEYTKGNLGAYGVRLGVNAPIGETFALRVDGSIRERDGYINDLISGRDMNTQDRNSIRAQALWDITEDASLRIIYDQAESRELCCGITPIAYGPTAGAIQLIAGADALVPINPEARNMTVTPGRNYREATDEQGISAELNWDLGGVDLTSITASRTWEAFRNQDVDFNEFDLAYRDGLTVNFDNFSEEIRLHGEWGRVDWLVGGFYSSEKLDTTDRIRIGAHFNAYLNALTMGNTGTLTTAAHPLLGPFSGGPVSGPFEFIDTTANDDDNPQINQNGTPQAPGVPQDPVESIFYYAGLGGFNPFPNIAPIPNVLPDGQPSNALLQNAYLLGNTPGVGQQADNWQIDTTTFALFTHNEIALTDALTWTVGVRFNHEEKDLSANLNSTSQTCSSMQGVELATDAAVPGPGGIITGLLGSPLRSLVTLACNPAINPIANGAWDDSRTDEEWTGTTSLSYDVSDDLMVYGGYSRGYKSGGYNVDRSGFAITPNMTNNSALNTDQLEFEPEFVDAYEIGFKSTLLGGSTFFNVNAYYQQIHDYQSNNFNGFNFITRNVPESISQGVEIDLLSHPTPNLTLQGGMLYNDSYYDSTVVFNTASPTGNTINAGDRVSQAPEWTWTGAVTYEQPIGDSLLATFYLDARWMSEYTTQTLGRDPLGRTDQDAFALFNGRIALGNPDDNWSIELWGRNLTEEFYFVGAFQATLQDGTYVVYPSEPRTYGITLRARY